MASGTINGTVTGSSAASYAIKIDWNSSPNPTSNSSTVNAYLYFRRTASLSYPSYNLSDAYASLSYDGGNTQGGTTTYDTRSTTDWILLKSASWSVGHNTDGSKQITLSASFTANAGSGMTGGSVNGTVGLDTIARGSVLLPVSDFTYDSNPNVGAAFSVPATKYVSSYYDVLTIKIGSVIIATRNNYTSGNVIFSSEEISTAYAAMQASNAATFTLELRTYTDSSKSTQIGSTSSTAAAGSISSTERAPILPISNITYVDTNAITKALTDTDTQMIKGFSDLKIIMSAKGSTRKGAIFNSNCYAFSVPGSATQYASNTDTLNIERTFEGIATDQFVVSVMDSRKNSTPQTFNIELIPYTQPVISSFTVQRQNLTSATVVAIAFAGTYYKWNFAVSNTKTIARYHYKESGGSSYGAWVNISTLSWAEGNFSGGFNMTGTFDVTKSYDFEIEIQDQLVSVSKSAILPTITPTMDIDTEIRRVAFGMIGSVSASGVQATAFYGKNGSRVDLIGESKEWNSNTIPAGYLLEDGTAVSRTTYADLFSVIGTTFGSGDGSTTFNIPNSKTRISVGRDSSDTSFDVLGETGGEKTHLNLYYEAGFPGLADHTHGIRNFGTTGTTSSSIQHTRSDAAAMGSATSHYESSYASFGMGGYGAQNASSAHNNLQPYIVKNKIIKY